MKKFKNRMLLLACGLVATVAVTTTSCKKDDGGTPSTVPTITSFTPTSAAAGATVTITGTNFTGATAVSFGSTAAASFSVVSASSITAVLAAGATGSVSVTTPSGTATKAGFTFVGPAPKTSDSVAHENLIAHWTFDTDSKEQGSGIGATGASGVTYSTAGQIGNCATFTNGYLVYPTIANINHDTALQSYSISMWVNMPTAVATDPIRSLFQVTGNRFPDIWGNVAFELVNNGVVGDSLPLTARQVQVDGLAPYVHMQTVVKNYGNSTNKWVFITQTYNGNLANQTMKLYANGALIATQELTTVDKSVTSTQSTFRVVPTGGSATPTPANNVYIGTLAFKNRGNTGGDGYGNFAPDWSSTVYPWAADNMTGKVDDIRLFNRPLTATEVSDLYGYGVLHK